MWRSKSTMSGPDRVVLQWCEMYERIFLWCVLLFIMVYKDTILDDATTEKNRDRIWSRNQTILYTERTQYTRTRARTHIHTLTHTHNTSIGCPNIYRVHDCVSCDKTRFLESQTLGRSRIKNLDRILSKYNMWVYTI